MLRTVFVLLVSSLFVSSIGNVVAQGRNLSKMRTCNSSEVLSNAETFIEIKSLLIDMRDVQAEGSKGNSPLEDFIASMYIWQILFLLDGLPDCSYLQAGSTLILKELTFRKGSLKCQSEPCFSDAAMQIVDQSLAELTED